MRFDGSRGLFGWPRRSTVDRSRGVDLRALKGTLWECDGWVLEDRVGCPGAAAAIEVAPAEAGAPIVQYGMDWWYIGQIGRVSVRKSKVRVMRQGH
jgi:hypothetical protein